MSVRDILQTAYEWIGELAVGESLDGAQIDHGLVRLNAIVGDLPQMGVGVRLTDRKITATTCVAANTRCVLDVGVVAEVDFPEQPGDGARVQIITATTNATWMYRSDLGDWVLLASLGLDDDSPYAPEFDDALAGMLAMRLAPSAGVTLTPELQAVIQSTVGNMKARYRQRVCVPTEIGLLRPTVQAYRGFCVTSSAEGSLCW